MIVLSSPACIIPDSWVQYEEYKPEPDKITIKHNGKENNKIILIKYSCKYIYGKVDPAWNIEHPKTKCEFTIKNISDKDIGKTVIIVESEEDKSPVVIRILYFPTRETITVNGEATHILAKKNKRPNFYNIIIHSEDPNN
jgi:hypothetical protein